jgi:hypothetical protein
LELVLRQQGGQALAGALPKVKVHCGHLLFV